MYKEIPLPNKIQSYDDLEEKMYDLGYHWWSAYCGICDERTDEIPEHCTICDHLYNGISNVISKSSLVSSWDDIWRFSYVILSDTIQDLLYSDSKIKILEGTLKWISDETFELTSPYIILEDDFENRYLIIKSILGR